MNRFDFLVRYMPIYFNFLFLLATLITMRKDFITLSILLLLNDTIHTQFKNEMIPSLYVWIIPHKKNSYSYINQNEWNNILVPSFHCQYIWFINTVVSHYIKKYEIGNIGINNLLLTIIGCYVVYNRVKNANNTFIQTFIGLFLGVTYGYITIHYILHI
jgi:hypothetical protein